MSSVAAEPYAIAKRKARFAIVLGAVAFVAVGALAWQGMAAVQERATLATADAATKAANLRAAARPLPAPEEIVKIVYVPKPVEVLVPVPEAPALEPALDRVETVMAQEDDPQLAALDAPLTAPVEPASQSCVDDLRAFAKGRTILFNIGSAELDPGKLPELELLGELAQACDSALVRVTGHSDSTGSDLINLALSWDRADSAIAALSDFGFSTERFEPVGFGARTPTAQGDDAEDELNRRVEFEVYEKIGGSN